LKVWLAVTLVVLIIVGLFLISFAVLISTRSISSTGQVTAIGVGVYQDAACSVNLTSISWGSVDPGSSTQHLFFIKNTGNKAENLSLSTSNWAPLSASAVLALSWDAPLSLAQGQITAVELTLTVPANPGNLTSFSLTITIIGAA
jgi:hypothetical protein